VEVARCGEGSEHFVLSPNEERPGSLSLVYWTGRCLEAERLLSEHAPDVALVDFHLRGGELSYSLIARLHEQGVPVILVSGSSESLSGLPVEAATILEKPVSEAQLLASLRPLLTQKEPR
jgi:DNA-binding response OmpR family regulator